MQPRTLSTGRLHELHGKSATTNGRNGRSLSKAEMITTWVAFHALGHVALHFPTQLGEIRDTHARLALWGLACDADHAHSPDGPFFHREAVRMRYKAERPPRLPIDLCRPGGLRSGAKIAAYRTSGTYMEPGSTGAESPVPELRLSEQAIALVRVKEKDRARH